jgi:hypothetical protein
MKYSPKFNKKQAIDILINELGVADTHPLSEFVKDIQKFVKNDLKDSIEIRNKADVIKRAQEYGYDNLEEFLDEYSYYQNVIDGFLVIIEDYWSDEDRSSIEAILCNMKIHISSIIEFDHEGGY